MVNKNEEIERIRQAAIESRAAIDADVYGLNTIDSKTGKNPIAQVMENTGLSTAGATKAVVDEFAKREAKKITGRPKSSDPSTRKNTTVYLEPDFVKRIKVYIVNDSENLGVKSISDFIEIAVAEKLEEVGA